jgi:hypothetical protein
LCDKLDQSLYHQQFPPISVAKEHLNCFLSFFDLMKGYPFHLSNFEFSNLKSLIDCFGITSLVQALLSKVPVPKTLEESLESITQSCCEILKDHFNRSLSLIIQNFSSIPFEALPKIPSSHLIRIFSSDLLQLECKDILFQLIVKMIEEGKNKIVLLKGAKLDYVSGNLLKEFLQKISNDEIDFELFKALKRRVIPDYSDLGKLSNRWTKNQKSFLKKEINELFQMLTSYCKKNKILFCKSNC